MLVRRDQQWKYYRYGVAIREPGTVRSCERRLAERSAESGARSTVQYSTSMKRAKRILDGQQDPSFEMR